MPSYRIHRLKESQRTQFRFAPHVSGLTQVKPRDYEPGNLIDAPHPYAAWNQLRDTDDALKAGDLLESPAAELRILKYVGFEEARWIVPDSAPPLPDPVVSSGDPELGALPGA